MHPEIIEEAGLDAGRYTGFAFGLGVERWRCWSGGLRTSGVLPQRCAVFGSVLGALRGDDLRPCGSLWSVAEYFDLGLSVEELAERLTLAGVETRPSTGSAEEGWEGIVVGLVTGLAPHPKADRLQLATVESGAGAPLTVVCGAPNVAVGQKVALAREGAELVDARSGARRRLQKARIRGVESAGMVCSERELGLSEEHEGILVLAASARWVGQPLAEALGQSALEVQRTPNRPDHLAVLGIAREVAALTGRRCGSRRGRSGWRGRRWRSGRR